MFYRLRISPPLTSALLLLIALGQAVPLHAAQPNWIWSPVTGKQAEPKGGCLFRKTIQIAQPKSGQIDIACDNVYRLFVNGRSVGRGTDWQKMTRYELGKHLKPGKNVIAIKATNQGSAAGMVARITVVEKNGHSAIYLSDKSWKTSIKGPDGWQPGSGWQQPSFDDSRWAAAMSIAPLGKGPWGRPTLVNAPVAKTFTTVKRPSGRFQFVDGDRVVLLGSTFIERAQSYGYLETAFTCRYSDRNITFRNLGWSGDNVRGRSWAGFDPPAVGFEKLRKQVFSTEPTVILLSYGSNESFAGQKGLDHFLSGLTQLLEVLDETGATIIFLSPLKQENLGAPLPNPVQFNANHRLYADAIHKIAKQRGNPFVDMYKLLGEDPKRTTAGPLTANGIHLSQYGYWQAAQAIEAGLDLPKREWSVTVRAKDDGKRVSLDTRGTKQIVVKKHSSGPLRFQLKDESLPYPALPHNAPASAAKTAPNRIVRFEGLPKGNYTLKIDGREVAAADARTWNSGVQITQGPEFDQVEKLRSTIFDKNRLYFYRWRPQNNTYLFLFRKREQGNNAVEIPMFDPLVQKKENEIAKLKMPAVHKYELMKTK